MHPAVTFILYIALIVMASSEINPVLTPVSLFCALGTMLIMGMGNKFFSLLKFTLPVLALVFVINSLFNGNGVTLLFDFFGRPVTLEAVLYGVFTIAAFMSVIIWATLLGELMGADEIICLFGRVSPRFALLLSMILGLVPSMLGRMHDIRDLRGNEDSKRTRLNDITALVFWSLETSLETATSMRARGFGSGKARRLTAYRFRSSDAAVAIPALLCIAAMLALKIRGVDYDFYPLFRIPRYTAETAVYYICFTLLMLTPILRETKEIIRWRYLTSRA